MQLDVSNVKRISGLMSSENHTGAKKKQGVKTK